MVWVVSGAVFSVFWSLVVVFVVVVLGGRLCRPRDWAADVCVKKAKGALLFWFFCGSASDVEFLVSRFVVVVVVVVVLGWTSARRRAICASLRVFSAMRAAFSFCVSMSLRRRV